MHSLEYASIKIRAMHHYRDGGLPLNGIHGVQHWRRVWLNGVLLQQTTPRADLRVIRLFSLLHDSHRTSDGEDADHGQRAGVYAAALCANKIIQLPKKHAAWLTHAIMYHNNHDTSKNPTIGACWDADRLDLWRVGIRPNPDMMSTDAGKRAAELFCL